MTLRIDAHHHVWDLGVRDQPWISGEDLAPIRRDFGLEEMAEMAATAGIVGTVVVQTVAEVAETEELLDLAASSTLVRGVVGYVDLLAADVGDQIDALRARPSGSALVGLRSLVQDEPDPDFLRAPAVVAGLREVAARGLVFDLLVRPSQLAAAADAVDAVPEGRFVLDHLAKPDIARGRLDPWAADIAALAERENVVAKLSGLVTEADWASWSVVDLRPFADHALEVFGPERLLFGSDWPVCTLAAPYEGVLGAAQELLVELSPSDRAAVFGGTAVAVYGLPDPSDGTGP